MSIIYSTYDLDDYFDATRQMLIDEREDPAECEDPADDVVWTIVDDVIYEKWIYLKSELEHKFNNCKALITGEIGRWDGSYGGGSIGDIDEILDNFTKDCDYVELEDADGELHIRASHHDGTNYGTIRILTNEGLEVFDEWEYDWDDHRSVSDIFKMLIENPEYSKPVKYLE